MFKYEQQWILKTIEQLKINFENTQDVYEKNENKYLFIP